MQIRNRFPLVELVGSQPKQGKLGRNTKGEQKSRKVQQTQVPGELGQVAYTDDCQQKEKMKPFTNVAARHLEQVVFLKLLKDASLQLDKLSTYTHSEPQDTVSVTTLPSARQTVNVHTHTEPQDNVSVTMIPSTVNVHTHRASGQCLCDNDPFSCQRTQTQSLRTMSL